MLTNRSMNATGKRLARAAFVTLLMAGVAGCDTSKETTGSISRAGKASEAMSASDLQGSMRCARPQTYASDPNNKPVALQLRLGAADERPERPVAGRHAQARHRLSQGPRRACRLRQGAGRRRRAEAGARCRAARADAGISRLAAGFGGRRHPRPARPDAGGARASTARRSTSSRTSRRCCPISACPTCSKAT